LVGGTSRQTQEEEKWSGSADVGHAADVTDRMRDSELNGYGGYVSAYK